MRSSEPDPDVNPELIKEALAAVPTEPDAQGFHAVAPVQMVTENRPGTFTAGENIVAVYRHEGRLYAVDSACTHEDGPLGESEVEDGGVITCPYHDWRFELSTGACLTDPSRPISCFAVKESGGSIWIGHKTSEGSSERGGEHDDGLVMDDT
jgi:nitrite reductase/ring-hydroxylating ferredoxin subunit